MVENSVRHQPLIEKIRHAATAAQFVQDGPNLFISGFTAGYPKFIPQELARRLPFPKGPRSVDVMVTEYGLVDTRAAYSQAGGPTVHQKVRPPAIPGLALGLLPAGRQWAGRT